MCKLLPTSPDKPDNRHCLSQYYSTGTERSEETVETSEEGQVECGAEQTIDDGQTDGRFFVIWYSDDEEEGESNEDNLDLEEEEESEDDTLKCLNIGTPKTINFSFVPNGKLMILGVPMFEHIIIRL